MHYVGLSRVRNSSGLHILNLNENKIKVSEKVRSEMSRLRTLVSLVPLAVTDWQFTPNKNNLVSEC